MASFKELDDKMSDLVDQNYNVQSAINLYIKKQPNERNREAVIEAARALYASDSSGIEIDDNALLSEGGDPGCYVMAWVWVDDSDLSDEHRPKDPRKDPGFT